MVTPSKAQFEVTKSDLNVKVLEFISALQCLNFCDVHNKRARTVTFLKRSAR